MSSGRELSSSSTRFLCVINKGAHPQRGSPRSDAPGVQSWGVSQGELLWPVPLTLFSGFMWIWATLAPVSHLLLLSPILQMSKLRHTEFKRHTQGST